MSHAIRHQQCPNVCRKKCRNLLICLRLCKISTCVDFNFCLGFLGHWSPAGQCIKENSSSPKLWMGHACRLWGEATRSKTKIRGAECGNAARSNLREPRGSNYRGHPVLKVSLLCSVCLADAGQFRLPREWIGRLP